FRSNRSGFYDLFAKRADGTGEERKLVESPENKATTDWSANWLLYTSLNIKTGSDIWALPMGGDGKPFPVLDTQADETDAHLSPDGKWMAYESNESGRPEIYIRPFPDTKGGPWQVSRAGGTRVTWRQDGKEIFFISADGRMTAASVSATSDGR